MYACVLLHERIVFTDVAFLFLKQNVYTLDDGNPRQTRIPCGHVCRVISFTAAEGTSREQIDELLADSIFVAQREQGFVKVMRTQSQVSMCAYL